MILIVNDDFATCPIIYLNDDVNRNESVTMIIEPSFDEIDLAFDFVPQAAGAWSWCESTEIPLSLNETAILGIIVNEKERGIKAAICLNPFRTSFDYYQSARVKHYHAPKARGAICSRAIFA